MTFGEALRYELIQVPKLDQKVFPIIAPEKTNIPFLVYRREEVEIKKTLSGKSDKVHAIYELTLVTNNYSEKEQIEENIKEKLFSFLFRKIGNDGPHIQNVSVRLSTEIYEYEVDLLSSKIKVEVDF